MSLRVLIRNPGDKTAKMRSAVCANNFIQQHKVTQTHASG